MNNSPQLMVEFAAPGAPPIALTPNDGTDWTIATPDDDLRYGDPIIVSVKPGAVADRLLALRPEMRGHIDAEGYRVKVEVCKVVRSADDGVTVTYARRSFPYRADVTLTS